MNKPQETRTSKLIKNLKKDFFYGLFVVLPLFATMWLVWMMINIISSPMNSILGQRIPAVIAFFFSVAIITAIGIAARNFLGSMVLHYVELLMNRIPIINTIYKSTKQVVNAFSMQDKKLLSAVLVEYPRKGVWALAFVTCEDAKGVLDKEGKDLTNGKMSLFVPTTPNPTSGYFIFVEKEDIRPLGMSIEESVKLLMSAGVLSPEKKENGTI